MMRLEVEQFRSIRMQSVDLAPITVLYGPNGSGKSSLIYALLVMKNVLLNMDRHSSDFFNLGFVNLGDRRSVIHDHYVKEVINLQTETKSFGCRVMYRMQFARGRGVLIDVQVFDGDNSINAYARYRSPFKSIKRQEKEVAFKGSKLKVTWEGIRGRVEVESHSQASGEDVNNARLLQEIINELIEFVRNIGMVPSQMGFSKGEYSAATTSSPQFMSEDEVGTLLASQLGLESQVSHYLERITGRDFKVHVPLGKTDFTLNAYDRNTGLETELVNDGFGINRLVWLLACALRDGSTWTCIEEPETHLHPSAVRKLAKVLVELAHKEKNQRTDERKRSFLISTHSETLVRALLAEVSRKNLKPEEVAFYLTTKEGKETKFERQEVNELGQIDDGLSSFMEGEMEDIAAFFEQTG